MIRAVKSFVLLITNHQSPITNHKSPITNHKSQILSFTFPSHFPVPLRHPGLAFALEKVPVHLRGRHLLFDVARPVGEIFGGKVGPRGKPVDVARGQELRFGTPDPFDEFARIPRMLRALAQGQGAPRLPSMLPNVASDCGPAGIVRRSVLPAAERIA